MKNEFQSEERYYAAKKQVEDIKGFYSNVMAYLVVNIGLVILNLKTTPDHLWFYWPLLWWGMGLVFHGLKVFHCMSFMTKDWEEKKIKEFMEKENHQRWE